MSAKIIFEFKEKWHCKLKKEWFNYHSFNNFIIMALNSSYDTSPSPFESTSLTTLDQASTEIVLPTPKTYLISSQEIDPLPSLS